MRLTQRPPLLFSLETSAVAHLGSISPLPSSASPDPSRVELAKAKRAWKNLKRLRDWSGYRLSNHQVSSL